MNQLGVFLDYLFTRKRWMIHILFWVMILAFYVVFFGRRNSNYLQTFFFVGLLMPVVIGTTYFLNYFLVPDYLMKERYGRFLLLCVYAHGLSFLAMMISMLTFIVMAKIKIKDMSPASIDIFFLLTSLLIVVFFGVAIKMMLHWRKSKDDYQALMRDKVEAELKFLKVQLNPHFLFNTLNNLYYLATEKSDKAPQAILQLSEILDYVMHSSKSVFIPLEKELKQVANYIALEMLRYEDRVEIESEVVGSTERIFIGPMILIILIENAFKHGVMRTSGKSWIKMKVKCNVETIEISISNSWRSIESGNGIGLENLKSQLSLLYQGNHTMNITSRVTNF
jgi:LytS/YehU family sensor histidine kinase